MFKEIFKGQLRHLAGGLGYASFGFLIAKGFTPEQTMQFYDILQFIGSLLVVTAAQGKSAQNAIQKTKLKKEIFQND